jgi:formiminotetrahydrofolate cyclodeaminase
MYKDKSISEYLDDLAAKKPAPGGGSAAAACASIGVSLMSMVANYTVGNPKYKAHEERIASLLAKVEKDRKRFESLIDEDVESYNRLSKGIKESAKDTAKLEVLYKEAMTPPFETCKLAYDCLKLCEELARYGNRNLVTDTAIAAIMLEGAFLSARFNVYINLKYIKDIEYIGMVHKTLEPLEKEITKLKDRILEKCEEVIQKVT